MKTIIDVKGLTKSFTDGLTITQVLKGLDFEVTEGEFVAIMGRSGAGKSTFLYQVSLLDKPTSGSIKLNGHLTDHMTSSEKTHYRLMELGYVFQDYSLLPELTALENIMVPLLMQGITMHVAKKRALDALESVNLANRSGNLPSELSGGEQQRVSIARAITHKPKILFADEPTANLDSFSSRLVMDIFKKLNKEDGLTIVMVTHEEEYGKMADRIVKLSDGMIVK
ncbi:MAG: ABC transporter ATP-binding protein [Candidatus Pacebacteria bacterium]|nr:ABC transporter ATP-binding protein [Candidatus Paceibacterota bacterium]MBP9867017.1 ABC transporter ATP-binding protein [Candidatus Paceibacterota bacterium]